MTSDAAAHRHTPLQTLRHLDTGPRGLTDPEAAARLAATGENTLPERRTTPWHRLFLRGLRDPFTVVLLCLGLVSALVASWGTAAVILALVAVSCVLRAGGEHRADRALHDLRELVGSTACVLRRAQAGAPVRAREIPVAELVPGDVVRLGPGDLVPADLRLLRASGLTVHQAALTGESAPVAKAAAELPGAADEGPFAQPHLCFQGSGVVSGSATAVVLATGARTRFAAVPFDPVRRLASAVVRGAALGTHTLIVKGAVEDVVERCLLAPGERDRLLALATREAGSGLRLLAVATAELPARTSAYTPADERGLTFRGLVAFHDAVDPAAPAALRALADLGVEIRILTGDHPATAARVCRDLGLDPGQVRVAARRTPQDKAHAVAALRAAGHTVGFLGDGLNDVPALRAADVGIAPRAAVDVARETADVVLAGKDLTAIRHAVTAGRHSSANIASYLRVTFSSNLGNVIAMLAAGLLLPFLPMLPAQVLAQNLCFDLAQLAFAHDRPPAAALRRPTELRPRAFLRFITGFGVLNAVADLATFAVLALALRGPDAMEDEVLFHSAWFTENLLTQALVMLLLRTGRSLAEGGGPGPVGRAAAVLAAVGLLLPPTPPGAALGMTGLPLPYYLLLAAVLGLYALALRGLRSTRGLYSCAT
ncbi:HAD-IC family P-type ATPase [Streptomyces sp. NPDC101175]|uniref:HAD-IC family P-type ATPase n=1 Tax=Streptomyces sp. NPDC101175 TaxID=3366123 RepID=UPI00383379D4